MAYPNTIDELRVLANKPGVVYDDLKTTRLFAEDVNSITQAIEAVETELGTLPKGTKESVKVRIEDIEDIISDYLNQAVLTNSNVKFESILFGNSSLGRILEASGGNAITIYSNAYYNGGWKRTKAGRASGFELQGGSAAYGGMKFYQAVDGAKDSAITWTTPFEIDNNGKVIFYGDSTLGDASTDVCTNTGRMKFRTTASDPQHATPASRPAGTVGEIAYYSGKMYICTNATTPTWEKITSS